MQGKWVGRGGGVRAPSFPFFCSKSQRGSLTTTRRLVRARLSPPRCWGGVFIQTGARECHMLPPFLSRFQRGRRECHTSPPFLSVSNGGGVWHSHHPPVSFHFERGQREYHMLLPSLFILNGGSVNPTHPFLFIYPPSLGGILFCGRGGVCISRRLCFCSFTPPLMGGFLPCGIDKQGRRETHTPPCFFLFNPPSLGGYFPLY